MQAGADVVRFLGGARSRRSLTGCERSPASGQHRCGTRQAYAPGPQEVASPASSRTSLAMLIADTALGQPV